MDVRPVTGSGMASAQATHTMVQRIKRTFFMLHTGRGGFAYVKVVDIRRPVLIVPA